MYVPLIAWFVGQNVGQILDHRESYDMAAARAVAELKVLGMWYLHFCYLTCYRNVVSFSFAAEYCLPLVRVGGLFVSAKGHDPHVSLVLLPYLIDVWYVVNLVMFHISFSLTLFVCLCFGQEEIENAKSAVQKLGASMLQLRDGLICCI
jgi:hypothetical protein